MGRGPQIPALVAGLVVAIAVVAIAIMGWRVLGPTGKTEMPPEAKAARERGLGHPQGIQLNQGNRRF